MNIVSGFLQPKLTLRVGRMSQEEERKRRGKRRMAAAQGLRQLQKISQEEGNKANIYSAECSMLKIQLWHVAGNIAEVKRLQTLL